MNTPSNYVGQPIRSLQTMLRTLAHADETLLKLVPDGIYGPNTVQAVREFQRQNGLPVTGETDNTTWNKLVAIYTVQSPSVLPAAPVAVRWTPNRVLAAGSRNSHLFLIQSMLQSLARFYANVPALTVTGVHSCAVGTGQLRSAAQDRHGRAGRRQGRPFVLSRRCQGAA